jgi:hypothetical protein
MAFPKASVSESSAVDSPGALVGVRVRAPQALEPPARAPASKGRPETVAPVWVG